MSARTLKNSPIFFYKQTQAKILIFENELLICQKLIILAFKIFVKNMKFSTKPIRCISFLTNYSAINRTVGAGPVSARSSKTIPIQPTTKFQQ